MLRRLLPVLAAVLVGIVIWSWRDDAAVVTPAGTSETSPPVASHAAPGAIVPHLRLIDQDGAETAVRDASGRVRIVTFIYARCPMPELCPLVMRHLETVRRRANDEGLGPRVSFLAVSLDPAFDTPAALRAYGESVLNASHRFDQWTLAT